MDSKWHMFCYADCQVLNSYNRFYWLAYFYSYANKAGLVELYLDANGGDKNAMLWNSRFFISSPDYNNAQLKFLYNVTLNRLEVWFSSNNAEFRCYSLASSHPIQQDNVSQGYDSYPTENYAEISPRVAVSTNILSSDQVYTDNSLINGIFN